METKKITFETANEYLETLRDARKKLFLVPKKNWWSYMRTNGSNKGCA